MLSVSLHRPFVREKAEPISATGIGWIALSISILGGCTFNGFAKVLSGALSPLSLLFISELLTCMFVIMTFGLIPTVRQLFRLKRRDVLVLLAMGTFSAILGPLLWFSGLQYTAAVNATFFGKTEVLFLIVMAHFTLKEDFTRAHALAGCAIAAGVMTIVFRGFTEGLMLSAGDLIIIAATFCYSMGSIIFRKYLDHLEPQVALLFRSSMAIALFFLVSPFLTHPFIDDLKAFPTALIPALLGFGFLSRFLNSVSFYEAIEQLPISTVTLFGTLEIVGGALFAYFYVGEPLYWYHAVGGALVLMGTVLLEFSGTATRTPPAQVPGTMVTSA